MLSFDSIIFDLDGTLWDPAPQIANEWNTILSEAESRLQISAQDIRRVAGLPHDECVRILCKDLDPSTQDRVQERSSQRETMATRGGNLFEGVAEGLPLLAQKFPLFIVSNCQAGYIEAFLEWSKFGEHFKDFECWGNTGKPKGYNLRLVIERNQLGNPIMVGDTPGDQHAAQENRIPFVFASYGYGEATQPQMTLQTFQDLMRCVI